MEITASMVKELRERSGAGMMECKKALVESNGDMEAAAEWLRKSGIAKAVKKSARVAAEGAVIMKQAGSRAVMVEINSETDFVAKDENFRRFAEAVGDTVLNARPANVEALMSTIIAGGSETVEAARTALVAKIGENVSVRRFVSVETAGGTLGSYMHGAKIGVLVDLKNGDDALAKDIAMHVAASRPMCVDESGVPAELIAKEKEIFTAQVLEEGKPANMVEKIVEGKIKKYLGEVTLLGQPFVKDDKTTVGKLLQSRGASIASFVRMEVGEGIEKKVEDFAAEVMKQAQGLIRDDAIPGDALRYRRVLIKLSGEALMGAGDFGIDPAVLERIADEVTQMVAAGVQVSMVIGGGNIFRGAGLAAAGMDRVTGDHMGMLATVINALALQDALERHGLYARVMSAIKINQICEDYIRRRAIRHLEKGRVVVFAAGTGNPFFTTDSAASLRAIEVSADLLIKATMVDGVYTADPKRDPGARRYDHLHYDEVLARKLAVMDATAVVLCRDNRMPLRVLDMTRPGSMLRAVMGENEGTLVDCGT